MCVGAAAAANKIVIEDLVGWIALASDKRLADWSSWASSSKLQIYSYQRCATISSGSWLLVCIQCRSVECKRIAHEIREAFSLYGRLAGCLLVG